MNDFEFAEALIRLDELIKRGELGEAEILYEEVKERLDTFSDGEKFSRLETYWEKIAKAREVQKRNEVVNISQSEIFQTVIKEQRRQFEVMKEILWYLKFFFWLTIIGLILMVISLFA